MSRTQRMNGLIVGVLLAACLAPGVATAATTWPNTGDVLVISGTNVIAVDPATRVKTLIVDVATYPDPEIHGSAPASVVMSRDGILWLAYRNSAEPYSNGFTTCTGCGGVVLRIDPDGTHSIVTLGFGWYPMGMAAAPDGSVVLVTGSSSLAVMLRLQAVDAGKTSVDPFFVPRTTFFPGCATPIIQGYAGYDTATGALVDSLNRPYIYRDANKNVIAAADAAGIRDALSSTGQLQPVRTDATGYIANPPGYVVGGDICDGDTVTFREARGVAVDQTTGDIFVGDVEGGQFATSSPTVPYCEQYGDCGGLYKLTLSDPLTVSQKVLIADFNNPNGFGPLGEDAGMAVAQFGSQMLVSDSTWWLTHDQQNSASDPCGTASAPAECYINGAVFAVASNGSRTRLTAYGDATQGQTGTSSFAALPMAVTLDGAVLLASCDGNNGPYFGTSPTGVQTRIKNPDSICQVDQTGFRTLWSDFGGTFNGASLQGVQAMSVVLPVRVLTPTRTTIAQSANGSTYGEPVTFTAFVTASGAAPTGKVTFYDGAVAFATGTLDASGTVTYATTSLPAGSHSITAAYAGDSTFAASVSVAITHPVAQATTTTTLSTSLNPAAIGQAVTFSVTVAPQFGGVPTGTVTFLDGVGTVLGTQPVDASGRASLTSSTLAAGAHSVTAVYGGDANFFGSGSSAVNEVIGDAADLSVTIVSSPAAPSIGSNVTLTIDIRNNGPNDVTSAFVQVALSGTLTFVSANSAAFNAGTRMWSVGALPSGTTSELQVVATITSYAGTATATVTSASPPDPNLANNTATAQIQPTGVIYVNGTCTLRAAIVAANTDAAFGGCPAGTPGLDIIVLPANSFHLYADVSETIDLQNGGDALPAVTSPIQIEGLGAVIGRSLDPVAPGPDMRIFYVKKGGALTLHNVTVRDGHVGGPGAGVLLEGKGASVVIDASNIVGNTTIAHYGAAVASSALNVLDDGDIVIRNGSLIAGNSAGYMGGGVFAAANLTIDNSMIGPGTANGTAYGGNTAGGYGAGLLIYGGQANVTNSTLQSNAAGLEGGGVYIIVSNAVVHIGSSTLDHNTAASKAGGVSNDAVLFIDNSSITGNSVTAAQGLGGGLVTGRFGTTQLTSSWLTTNFAPIGGGLWNSRQTTLTDTQVAYNNAWSGAGLVNAGILAMTRGGVYQNVTYDNPAYDGNGGGILNLPVNDVGPSAQLVLDGTYVAANIAAGGGGGIANYGPATLTNVTVGGLTDLLGNVALKAGGGILVSNTGLAGAAPAAVASLSVNGGGVAHNVAYGQWNVDGGGGGLANGNGANSGGTVSLTDVEVSSNRTPNGGEGGGIFNRAALNVLRGTVLTNAAGASGGGLANGSGAFTGGVVTVAGTLFDGNTAVEGGGNISQLTDGSGSLLVRGGTIRNGVANAGGGIASNGAVTIADGAVIEANRSSSGGGGVYVNIGTTLNVSNASIRNNVAGAQGGGIFTGSTLTASGGTIIEGNQATDGGGITTCCAHSTISNATIRNNSASNQGGGLYTLAAVDIDGSSFTGNQATGGGGIMALPSAATTIQISNSTISGNKAVDWGAIGGSIRLTATLTNVTVSGNTASDTAHGNLIAAGSFTVASSTIVDNIATTYPFATDAAGTLSFTNSIVMGNRESDGGAFKDCAVYDGTDGANVVADGSNLFGAWASCPIGASDKTLDPALLFTNVLAPLADNGGPTQTHALIVGSPAIDAGAPVCPATDQRGLMRPADGDGDDIAVCDIGAFELQSAVAAPPGAATHCLIAAPAAADAGAPFSFRVTALDAANNVATGYAGTIHFTSTDASATLPVDSALINGTGLFSATLRTGGPQTLTATDPVSGMTATSASIVVTVIRPPVLAKAFSPQTIQVGQISTLTLTISNPNAADALNDVAFDDPFPVNVFVAAAPNVTNTCGGTVTATPGAGSVALSGGTLAAAANCHVAVDVIATGAGGYTNRTSAVSSSNGGSGNIATAELDVNPAPSTTTLTVAPTPALSGQTVTLHAVVTPSGGAVATGVVAFFADGVQLGRVTIAAEEATFTTAFLGLGGHTLSATYLGNGTVASSTSAPVAETVNDAVTAPSRAASPNPKMDYYGGSVVSNVDVRVVFWGAGVDPAVQARIGDFYATLVASPFMDLLSEYSTSGRSATAGVNAGQPGSNQLIGHGTYGGAVAITPALCNAPPCLVYDNQIQDEINRQIQTGALAAPTYDAGGHPNTAFLVYFPAGITINFGSPAAPGVNSCQAFVGYHSTGTTSDGRDLLYGVVPDQGSCNLGPYGEPTTLEDATLVSSHELAEIVTDPSVGKVSRPLSKPLGWYSEQQSTSAYYGESFDYGELADVCDSIAGAVNGYTVQLVWSNHQNACAVAGPPLPTVTVTVGTSPAGASFTVDGVTYSTPQTFTWPIGTEHSLATVSPQPAGTGTRLVWSTWSDGQPMSHSVTASAATTSYTANFSTEYQLTIAASPAAGGSVSPSTGQFYGAGSIVNVSATPSPNYVFANWTGPVLDAAAAATTVTMSAPQTLTANFSVAPPVLTSIAVTPVNPSIAAGAAQPFTATGSYSDGSTKNLTADVTWTSGTPAVATITVGGVATATGVGTSTIGATLTGVTGSTALTVTRAATSTVLTSTPNPSKVGQSITVTATVTGDAPGGSITFNVDGGALMIGPVALIAGTASTSLSSLAAGTHTIVASYSGDVNNQSSTSTALSQVVNTGAGKAPTTATLTTSGSPSAFGAPVVFTATVTGTSPTGTVAFADQNSTLATVPLINGVATFTTSTLSKGAHQITATYSGDNANLPSTSAKVKQQVQ